MKKLILITALLSVFMITGCQKNTANSSTATPSKEAASESENDNSAADSNEVGSESRVTVEEAITKQGSVKIPFEEDDFYEVTYDYHIPEISDDSVDAKMINSEIMNLISGSIRLIDEIDSETAEEIYEPEWSSFSYEYYENGDVLSLVITMVPSYYEGNTYAIFNYSTKDHKQIKNKELLEIAGLSEDEFYMCAKAALSKAAVSTADDFAANLKEIDDKNEDSSYLLQIIPGIIRDYVSTVNDETSLSIDVPMYLGADGNLNFLGNVYVQAGAGVYVHILKIDPNKTEMDSSPLLELAKKYHYPAFEKDLIALYEVEGYSATQSHKTADGASYESNYYIGFDDSDPSLFVYQDNNSEVELYMVYTGKIEFTDVNENGIVYTYTLDNLNGEKLKGDDIKTGSFYLTTEYINDYEQDEYYEQATYQYINGDDLFDSNGKPFILKKSFG